MQHTVAPVFFVILFHDWYCTMLKQTFLAATKPFPAPILISQTFFPCSSYLLQAVYSYTNNSKSVDRWSHTSFTDLVLAHRQRMFSDAAIQVKKNKTKHINLEKYTSTVTSHISKCVDCEKQWNLHPSKDISDFSHCCCWCDQQLKWLPPLCDVWLRISKDVVCSSVFFSGICYWYWHILFVWSAWQ